LDSSTLLISVPTAVRFLPSKLRTICVVLLF
jgi:hypothetical protein